MKTFIRIFVLAFLVTSCSATLTEPLEAQQGYVSFQVFYDQLGPYGYWVDYPAYGYVWIPRAGPDFYPYLTDGYWVYTGFGWTWVSDYPWGWAPFHYGRWDFDDALGWFWVPDYLWGPCWVTWRWADGYYGWAPMRPGVSVGLSFSSGYRDPDRWVFVRDRDLTDHDISRRYVDRRDNDDIIAHSTVIRNTYSDNRRSATYVAGPELNTVQRATGRRISVVSVRDNNRPGESFTGNQLEIYRPRIERTAGRRDKPAPSSITDIREIRPAGESHMMSPRNRVSEQVNPAMRDERRQQQAAPRGGERQRIIEPQRQEPVRPREERVPINRGRREQQMQMPSHQNTPAMEPGRNRSQQMQMPSHQNMPAVEPGRNRSVNEPRNAPPVERNSRSRNRRSRD